MLYLIIIPTVISYSCDVILLWHASQYFLSFVFSFPIKHGAELLNSHIKWPLVYVSILSSVIFPVKALLRPIVGAIFIFKAQSRSDFVKMGSLQSLFPNFCLDTWDNHEHAINSQKLLNQFSRFNDSSTPLSRVQAKSAKRT